MSNAVQMVRHPRVQHVQYALVGMRRGQIQIHAECDKCGELFDWVCIRGPDMAYWRIEHFANFHTHDIVPRIMLPPMPE
ncbi:MAG: hypothetical protein WC683_02205 [bacterium]